MVVFGATSIFATVKPSLESEVMKWVIGLIIAAVCVSVIDAHLAQDLPPNLEIPIPNPIPIRRPPKYNKFQSRRQGVSRQQFTSQIATGQWLGLYSVLTGTPGYFGKGRGTWRVSGNTVTRTLAVSQDPSKYFWWDLCEIQGTTRGFCRSGFFDLVIKDTRTNLMGDLNLVGLPWDRIAADLRAIRGLTFDNSAVTYVWIGPGMDEFIVS
ncbi:hypothetical protein DPMN_194614 [Dreissena polymorpha]|uniref:Uncharacterized protein n=1 Tax=Dreissena polymorpha TaxID=45954 RepID=A0A9D4BGM6_DREPO|nr:hypothetical protein DPMN_194614 [Dreissena polymorpha]